MSSDWKLIKDSFHAALDLAGPERAAFVDSLPETIASEVRELLISHESLDNFIDTPAPIGLGLASPSLVGTEIGSYRLVELVGAGGMGSVYRAEKRDVGRGFAVKLIKRGMDSDAVLRRFDLERRILARLEHPNIARLLDGGTTTEGLPYFVMEFVDGVPLTRYCRENNLDLRARLALFRRICDAVSYAHRNLVVHRDLKPSNILVTVDGTPKLLDFGIAKLLDAGSESVASTATQARAFTPEYASPEQHRGLPVTTASDVYSLGVVLYEILCGKRPFGDAASGGAEFAERVMTDEPQPVSVVCDRIQTTRGDETVSESRGDGLTRAEIDADVDNVVLKALRKEPERRYGSVVEMSDDIARYLAGRPVSATADSRRYRLSKFVARHKRGVLTAVLAASVLIGVSGVAVRQGLVATAERKKAEKRLEEIRLVAKSLINETNDSLAKIPGNVAVQRSLAEKSVGLLDSLAFDEGRDAEVEGELADAYVKLAEIQNWSFRDFDKAVLNLEKADAIYMRMLGRAPDESLVRRKIYTAQLRHIEALHNTGRREEMLRIGADAIGNLRELVRLSPDSVVNLADLAAMHGWFGDKYSFFGRAGDASASYAAGIEFIERAIGKRESNLATPANRAEFARLFFIKGWLLNGSGDPTRAIESYRRASLTAREVFAEDPSVPGNFLRAVGGFEAIGEISTSKNDYGAAFEAYRDNYEFATSAATRRDNPQFGDVSYYRCFYAVRSGSSAARVGRKAIAEDFMSKGLEVCRESISQDDNDTSRLFDSLPYFFEIAEFRAVNGRQKEAVAELQEIASRIGKVLNNNPEDLSAAFALAETFEKIGDIDNARSGENYQRSLAIWKDYSAKYSLVPEERGKMERAAAKGAR